VRIGRPPHTQSGEVETRILDAARLVFLEQGLGGATIDEIAALARAGKPTIYARFGNKEALFAAVVVREVDESIGHVEAAVPRQGNLEERCTNIAMTLLHWALFGRAIGLMRLAISEAHRLPDLATNVHATARQHGANAVSTLLSEAARSDESGVTPAFAPENLTTTTRIFLDLVLLPLMLRALFGEDPRSLRNAIGPHVASRVAFFLAACRGPTIPAAPSDLRSPHSRQEDA
jgi:AcrR family transcriptional regulator